VSARFAAPDGDLINARLFIIAWRFFNGISSKNSLSQAEFVGPFPNGGTYDFHRSGLKACPSGNHFWFRGQRWLRLAEYLFAARHIDIELLHQCMHIHIMGSPLFSFGIHQQSARKPKPDIPLINHNQTKRLTHYLQQ